MRMAERIFSLAVELAGRFGVLGSMRLVSFVAGLAAFILPYGLVGITFRWLELREKRGLSQKQLPPRLRWRWLWQIAIYSVGFLVLVFFTVMPAPSGVIHYDDSTEWSFTPNAGGFDKLGLRATFTQLFQRNLPIMRSP